jgi:hypothetical protein
VSALKDLAFWIKIGLFFLAVALLFAGERLDLGFLTALGWLVFGILAVFAGAEVIVTREASFSIQRGETVVDTESYSGCAAQLWGGMFVLFGLALALGSLAALAAPERAMDLADRALDEPWGWGILIVVFGTFTAMYGLTRALAGAARVSPGGNRGFRQTVHRIMGFIVLLAGLGLVGIGLALIVFPETVLGLVRDLAAPFTFPLDR